MGEHDKVDALAALPLWAPVTVKGQRASLAGKPYYAWHARYDDNGGGYPSHWFGHGVAVIFPNTADRVRCHVEVWVGDVEVVG